MCPERLQRIDSNDIAHLNDFFLDNVCPGGYSLRKRKVINSSLNEEEYR